MGKRIFLITVPTPSNEGPQTTGKYYILKLFSDEIPTSLLCCLHSRATVTKNGVTVLTQTH